MQSDLMALVDNLADLTGKRFDGMCWCKPCRLDIVLVPQLKQSVDSDRCTEHTSRYIRWIGWCTIARVYPVGM